MATLERTARLPLATVGTLPRRNLPDRQIDLIRDGVPTPDLRARGDRATYAALISTAMSAIQHGWTFPEWHGLLAEERSTLRRQVRLAKGRRDIGRDRYEKQVQRAWAGAQVNIANSPALTREQIAAGARAALADVDAATLWTATKVPADRLVYMFALAEAARRGTTRPTLPVRDIEAATGVPKSTAPRSLQRLASAGLLTLHRAGTRGAGGSGRASLYVVPAVAHANVGKPTYVPRVADLCPTVAKLSVP